jgi:hypothetical protein
MEYINFMNLSLRKIILIKKNYIIKFFFSIIFIIYGIFTLSLSIFLFGILLILENIIRIILKDKFKRKYAIVKYGLLLLIIIVLYFLAENKARTNDEFKIWRNKIILPYLIKSYLPNNDMFILDRYEIDLPFGYSLIDKNFSISIIDNTYLNLFPFFMRDIIFNGWERKSSQKFIFIDQFGSVYVWKEKEGEKLLYFIMKRRGGIDYLYAEIK